MTCKDCIHCDVCSDWENICNKMSLFSTIKKEVCKDFKDKSKIIELPCKVGDTVYEPRCDRGFIQEYIVIAIHFSKCSTLYGWELKDGKGIYSNTNGFSEYAIGKTVFLTRKEAEQALRESKDNGV